MIAAVSTSGRVLTWEDGELTGDPDLISVAKALPGVAATVTGPWVLPDWSDPATAALFMATAVEDLEGAPGLLVGAPPAPQYGPGCCDPEPAPKLAAFRPGARLKEYNPDQPRDADGRFGSGGDTHYINRASGGPPITVHADGTSHEGPERLWTEENRHSADYARGIDDPATSMGYTKIDALPRTSREDPIEPHLATIERRASTFYADPANQTEVLSGNDPKLVGYRTEAEALMQGFFQQQEVSPNSDEGRRLYEGLNYLKSALSPSGRNSNVVVATRDGHIVAALDFQDHQVSHDRVLDVNLLGSAGKSYGAATAIQHELASYGTRVGADSLRSEATLDAVPYHQSIGRVVTGLHGGSQFPASAWSAADMAKIAALPVRPSS